MGRLLSASMDGKRVWVESGEGMGGGVMTFTCTTSGHRRLDIDIASAVGLDQHYSGELQIESRIIGICTRMAWTSTFAGRSSYPSSSLLEDVVSQENGHPLW